MHAHWLCPSVLAESGKTVGFVCSFICFFMYHVLSDSHLLLILLSFLFFFFFVATFVAAFFLLFVYFALNFLLNPSFLFSQTWINTLKPHFSLLPFPLPLLFYLHIFSPFPLVLSFSPQHLLMFFFPMNFPVLFLVFCTSPQGRLNKDLGLFSLTVQNWRETTLKMCGTNSVLTVLWHEDDWEQINSCLANLTSPKNSGSILPAGNWII